MATHTTLQKREGGADGYDDFSVRVNDDEGASEIGKVWRKRGNGRVRRTPSIYSSVRRSFIAVSRLRLRRASQLAVKRRGPSTPVPSWKLVGDVESAEANYQHHHHLQGECPSAVTVSARRLAAILWELQAIPFSSGCALRSKDVNRHPHNKKSSTLKLTVLPQSPASSCMSKEFLKPPVIQSKMEPARRGIPSVDGTSNTKALWKDLVQGPATSYEFSKVLKHVRSLEEQHKSSVSLVESLRGELDEARMQLQQLLQSEKDHRVEMEDITKRLIEEHAMWQEKQAESIGLAVQSIKGELYHERKGKNRLESLHRRMVKEFQDLKKALAKTLHDLQREKKARELMEDVCDELAREIGEDRARVEEMKLESAKVREEVEEERKMLQMAEIWREERVQMKLMEAKLELEEKNTALDKLRGELEAFLKAKRAANVENHTSNKLSHDGCKKHSQTAVVGKNLAEPFHASESRAPARHSVDSQPRSVSRPKQRLQGLGEDPHGSSVGEYDLHANAVSNEVHTKQDATCRSQLPYYHQEVNERERRSSNRRVSNSERSKQRQVGRYQRLQRSRSSQLREGRKRRNHYLADTPSTQWVEGNGERGDKKEWSDDMHASAGDDHEETIKTWPSENKGSQGLSPTSPGPRARHNEQYEEAYNMESSGMNTAWLRQIVESSGDLPATLVPMHQQLYAKSSPTLHWNHFWSSPDPGSPHQGKGKGSGERLSNLRDNSLKAKLLEAKLEGQQARLRPGMG